RALTGPGLFALQVTFLVRAAAPATYGLRLPARHASVRDGYGGRTELGPVRIGDARLFAARGIRAHPLRVIAAGRGRAVTVGEGAGDGAVLVAAALQVLGHAHPRAVRVGARLGVVSRAVLGACSSRAE